MSLERITVLEIPPQRPQSLGTVLSPSTNPKLIAYCLPCDVFANLLSTTGSALQGEDFHISKPVYEITFSLERNNDLGTNSRKQIDQDITGEANGDDFGGSISLSGDGRTLAIGAWGNKLRI
ncbi:hypothetical protein ACHAXA_004843 [Cyclostephanos tholiformis]|uniref:Uncharacterized protein n=1 Tax=Cyclostephanos tholiformis TaxID=382380 RepID=A0ABD3SHC7_9STRA